MIEEKIMKLMDEISYGVPGENGGNLLETTDEDEVFTNYYYLQSPDELIKSKLGTCWDQVELERKYFEENKIKVKTYFICTYDGDNLPSHTFLTYEKEDKYSWFEHSWSIYKGIHEYKTEKELLLDVKEKFINSHSASENAPTFVYLYQKPPFHMTCNEVYNYMETEEVIKLNKPLYFYHLVDKNADISKGLLSPKYMYEHNLYDLFDKSVEKYKYRIVNSWNIKKYKNREEESLTREEIMDALNIFRGEYGSSYIYFFKFPPYKSLGPNMSKLLETKNIYRININDEIVQKNINDIFWGYKGRHSDNELLDKSYYEKISEEEYFKNYDDESKMIFSTLNHISIAFKSNYCKSDFLEKIN